MTDKSLICNIIHDNSTSWKHIFDTKSIKIKEHDDLAIFNYDIDANFHDPVVQEARGIIINTASCDVVCWPFRKFGNYHESYADEIDWSTAVVQEKIDGSIIKIWFNIISNKWQISSNSCIDANEALLQTGISVASLVASTKEYKDLISSNILNKNNTYIFELIGPYNQVVVRYNTTQLCLLGIRNNKTGEEFSTNIITKTYQIRCPKNYAAKNLKDCINAAKSLNNQNYPDIEGFVVVDANWNRIKVKSPEYLIYHHLMNNGLINKEKAWELIHTDDFKMEDFEEVTSEINADIVKYYAKAFEDTKNTAIDMMNKARNLQKYNLPRKEIAMQIKNDKFAYFGFKALDNDTPPETILTNTDTKKFLNFVEDYTYKADTLNEK